MADSVASKSGFLCMYMSNHPDTLVSYVKHWGKVNELVASAKMASIDSKGMTLTYTVQGSTAQKEVNVPFVPPLSGYDEVKPRLLRMKVDAEVALGMSRTPQITTFEWSRSVLYITPPILFLIYCTVAPTYVSSSPFFSFGAWTRALVGETFFKGSWAFLVLMHSTEAVYAARLCRKHRTPFLVGVQHVACTLAFGVFALSGLWKQIQTARIESIMKGE